MSEASGFEEGAGDVVGEVAEAEGGAAQAFEAAVDGFGVSVRGSRMREEREDIVFVSVQGPPQPTEFFQVLRHSLRDGPYQLVHRETSEAVVFFAADRNDVLVDIPGHLDRGMSRGSKQGLETFMPGRGKELPARQQGFTGPIQWVTSPSAPAKDLLLGALTRLIHSIGGKLDNMEGIHHRHSVRQLLGGTGEFRTLCYGAGNVVSPQVSAATTGIAA